MVLMMLSPVFRFTIQFWQWLMENNPAAINTYFNQENPCCWVYAQMNATGMRVNVEAIYKAQDEQRIEYAAALRKMKNCWPKQWRLIRINLVIN